MGVHLPPARRAEHYMGMPETAERWTAEMVRPLPDDRKRYEVIDGELFVTPAPSWPHQRTVGGLFLRLSEYLRGQPWAVVSMSPADISFREDMLVQPDLFVVPIGADRLLPRHWSDIHALLLAIEVLSPSTEIGRYLIPRGYAGSAGFVRGPHRCGPTAPEALERYSRAPPCDRSSVAIDRPRRSAGKAPALSARRREGDMDRKRTRLNSS